MTVPQCPVLARLADPSLYAAALSTVTAKERERESDEPLLPGGPPATGITFEREQLCERLAKLVSTAHYQLSPVSPRLAIIEGKSRVLYHSPPLDVVVMTALARVLGDELDYSFSPRLFSYRKGRSPHLVLRELAEFVSAHRAGHTDPRMRGLYVARRDVKSYGDAIPSGPDSKLWKLLRNALASRGVELDEARWSWLVRAIRPPITQVPGFDCNQGRGIPTGSPLQPLMGNLYLSEVDWECQAIEGGFYSRFGDDILFAHPDPDVAQRVAASIDERVSTLGLTYSRDKCRDLFVTAAGRPSQVAPRNLGASSFDYLGMRVDARGLIGLSAAKSTRLLRDVEQRLDAARRLAGELSFEASALLYCEVVNATLAPEHEAAERSAQLLRGVVTDRSQLRDLDYQLALRVAKRLSKRSGPRVFRDVPIRLLKQRFGLRSLVVQRNLVDCARRRE